MKKDRYLIPLVDELLQRVSKAKIFTKLDIHRGFHRIRMHPGSEDLTTFRTPYGSFKYKVMLFGLTNGLQFSATSITRSATTFMISVQRLSTISWSTLMGI